MNPSKMRKRNSKTKKQTSAIARNSVAMIKTHEKIETVIEKVRPYIQMHGGDVCLLGYRDGVVTIKVYGTCTHCSLADLTYNNLILGLLKEEIPEIKEILIEK